jgi:hypothetical protein
MYIWRDVGNKTQKLTNINSICYESASTNKKKESLRRFDRPIGGPSPSGLTFPARSDSRSWQYAPSGKWQVPQEQVTPIRHRESWFWVRQVCCSSRKYYHQRFHENTWYKTHAEAEFVLGRLSSCSLSCKSSSSSLAPRFENHVFDKVQLLLPTYILWLMRNLAFEHLTV